MKLYNSGGPNPRMVRMFMAEKGFDVPKVDIDLRGGENRREPFVSKVNPAGQCPALELDDGSVLAEITAICEYVDEKKKDTPSLIGDTPEERAKTRMWVRRIDLNIAEPGSNGFRFSQGQVIALDEIFHWVAKRSVAFDQDHLAFKNAHFYEAPA
jgi:glutathione S-transferase